MKIFEIIIDNEVNYSGKLMAQKVSFPSDETLPDYEVDFEYPKPFPASEYIQTIRLGIKLAEEGYTHIKINGQLFDLC